MKKTIIILLMMLTLVSISLAAAPSFISFNELDSNGADSSGAIRSITSLPNYVAIDRSNQNLNQVAIMNIFDEETGSIVYNNNVTAIGFDYRPADMSYYGGFLARCIFDSGGGTTVKRIQIFDVSSIGFVELVNDTGTTFSSSSAIDGCTILDTNSGNVRLFINDLSNLYTSNVIFTISQSSGIYSVTNVTGGNGDIVFIDRSRRRYSAGPSIYSYDDITNHVIVETATADVIDCVDGGGSPLCILDNGKLWVSQDGTYSNMVESSDAITTFTPYFIAGFNNILGIGANNNWYMASFDGITITEMDTGTDTLTFDLTGSSGVTHRDEDTIFLVDFDTAAISTRQNLSVWEFQGAGATSLGNTPPIYNINFLGIDETLQNFVFKVTMLDAEGGPLYHAVKVGEFGTLGNTTINQVVQFDQISDISNYVVENGFCDFNSLTFTTGNIFFDSDGSLYHNQSSCVGYVQIDPADVSESQLSDDFLEVSTTFGFKIPTPGDFLWTDYLLRTSDGHIYGQLTFYINDSAGTVNITIYDPANNVNETEISFDTYVTSAGIVTFTVLSNINFSSNVVNYRIFEGVGIHKILDYDYSFLPSNNNVNDVRYLQWTSGIENFYVDYLEFSYQKQQNFPSYKSFGNTQPGQQRSVSDLENIPDGFGHYEALLYGTDITLGLNYYEAPSYIDFFYDEDTRVLTSEEISAIVGGDDDFILGDIWTDTVENKLFSLLGIKSTKSKMLVGLILLIAITLIFAGFGSEVVLLVDAIGFVIITLIGLFPLWFAIVVVVLAGGLVMAAMRRGFVGQ